MDSGLIFCRDFLALYGFLPSSSFLVNDCNKIYRALYPWRLLGCAWSFVNGQVYLEELRTYDQLPQRSRKCLNQNDCETAPFHTQSDGAAEELLVWNIDFVLDSCSPVKTISALLQELALLPGVALFLHLSGSDRTLFASSAPCWCWLLLMLLSFSVWLSSYSQQYYPKSRTVVGIRPESFLISQYSSSRASSGVSENHLHLSKSLLPAPRFSGQAWFGSTYFVPRTHSCQAWISSRRTPFTCKFSPFSEHWSRSSPFPLQASKCGFCHYCGSSWK